MHAVPTMAVVVATHNRAHLLPRLIRALEAQVDAPAFEVIVVDDCSTDATPTMLAQLAASARVPLRTARTSRNSGPATARNTGWRMTAAERIAFTDDDAVPEPGWLAVLDAALDRADVVQGRTRADVEALSTRGPFARVLTVDHFSHRYETCNMGYRRGLLEKLGGFDEWFPRPFGEDVDLGWRAAGSGAATAWEDGAVVVHDVEHTTWPADWVASLCDVRRSAYVPELVRRHPGLRDRWLYRRLFYKPSHPSAILALAGVAAVLLRPSRRGALAATALLGPYVWFRTTVSPPNTRPSRMAAVIPLLLVHDCVEVGAMVVGSARYRTLVL